MKKHLSLVHLSIDLHIPHLLTCLLILPILFIYLTFAKPSFAQPTQLPTQQFLNVSPVIEDLQLHPGHPTTYQLTITNKGDKPVGFHLDVTGIDPTDDQTSFQTSPLLSWISIKPTDLIVSPHEKNIFTVTIHTPKNAQNSGYYATLFLTPFISNPLKPSGPIILERIGTLLLTTIGHLNYNDLASKVHISYFGYDGWWHPQNITFALTNHYFTHFTAKPRVVVSTLLDHQTILWPEEQHVLPGTTRTWTIPITIHWYTIYSTAELRVSIGDGKELFAQAVYINYAFLLGIVIGVCLLLFIIKRIKHFKKALSVLFTGHE